MEKFKQYLVKALQAQRPLKLCFGNVSCDMDSVVGSLALGYYFNLSQGGLYTPAINCPKILFKNKLEITMHLSDFKLDDYFDKFLYQEDLQELSLNKDG